MRTSSSCLAATSIVLKNLDSTQETLTFLVPSSMCWRASVVRIQNLEASATSSTTIAMGQQAGRLEKARTAAMRVQPAARVAAAMPRRLQMELGKSTISMSLERTGIVCARKWCTCDETRHGAICSWCRLQVLQTFSDMRPALATVPLELLPRSSEVHCTVLLQAVFTICFSRAEDCTFLL